MRSSADGVPTTRSESPEPRLSSMITTCERPKALERAGERRQLPGCSIWFQKVLNSTRSRRAAPKGLVGDAHPPARAYLVWGWSTFRRGYAAESFGSWL